MASGCFGMDVGQQGRALTHPVAGHSDDVQVAARLQAHHRMPVRPQPPAGTGNGGDDHGAEEKTGLVSHGGYPRRPAQLATGLVTRLVKGLVKQAEVIGDAVEFEPVGPCPGAQLVAAAQQSIQLLRVSAGHAVDRHATRQPVPGPGDPPPPPALHVPILTSGLHDQGRPSPLLAA